MYPSVRRNLKNDLIPAIMRACERGEIPMSRIVASRVWIWSLLIRGDVDSFCFDKVDKMSHVHSICGGGVLRQVALEQKVEPRSQEVFFLLASEGEAGIEAG